MRLKKENYELKPRVGRINDFKKGDHFYNEKKMLDLFKERAIPFIDIIPENEWQWLAVAQHFRLPTRLLDWSRNPLVAAYFAVDEKFDGNSAIYVLKSNIIQYIEEDIHEDPFQTIIDERGQLMFAKYIPPHIVNRITGQSSIFTYHANPEAPYEGDKSTLEKIIIENKNDFRRELKKIIYHYGIHKSSLFTDLESLSNHIEWMKRDVHDINE